MYIGNSSKRVLLAAVYALFWRKAKKYSGLKNLVIGIAGLAIDVDGFSK